MFSNNSIVQVCSVYYLGLHGTGIKTGILESSVKIKTNQTLVVSSLLLFTLSSAEYMWLGQGMDGGVLL